MTLIEGIGDEVTQFFIILFALVVCYIAWWTTSTREQQQIRIFVLNGRQRNYSRLSSHVQTASIMEGSHLEELNHLEEISENDSTPTETETVVDTLGNVQSNPETSSTTVSSSENSQSSQSEDEPSTILRMMDLCVNTIRHRRTGTDNQSREIAEATGNTSDTTIESSNEQPKECNSQADETKEKDTTIQDHTCETIVDGDDTNDNSKIIIKLKFLNDELKPVDGKLQEHLGAFKRRHFEAELSSNKVVRLIFNGQVLQQDDVTLASCGLFDNCVVHCLIHQKKPSPLETGANNQENRPGVRNTIPRSHNSDSNNPVRDWDLGNLLFFLISFILVTVWYFRYEYAHLYTVTATVALVVVTGIFAVVMFGLYFPDREQTMPQPIH
ncbi:transmembrane and ubiquitin-like domain-containing protein 1 [Agrilus planipennis]|uniref:Transmembrane and ubiquitin-like domain-containing protein 1 n=1 Tax=Agrilus planipennis TaxID=224129 RepID=A0A1W4WU16_AGRPL|nr:transmembrane and ubiquitin-like domain-containing protein 1 [Agrilus planipennis]